MMDRFDCDDVGEMNEYVGCKVDYDREQKRIRLTQPVMIQSFVDEFDLPKEASPKTQRRREPSWRKGRRVKCCHMRTSKRTDLEWGRCST